MNNENKIYNSVLPYSFKENIYALKSIFSTDKHIYQLESQLSDYTGKYAVALDSCLSAILLFLKLNGISVGDEIAIPAYLCERVGFGLLSEGYHLNFIDVDDNYNISLIDLEKTPVKTKAIIAVHSYGIPCEIAGVREIAKKYGAILIEDSAQSFGGRVDGKLLGTSGDAGVYSFGWFKPITTMGGGALISSDKKIIESAKTIVSNNYKIKDKIIKLVKSVLYMNKRIYYKTIIDLYSNMKNKSCQVTQEIDNYIPDNYIAYRIQNIQAGIGKVQLNRADEFNRARIYNTKIIIDGLSSLPIKFPIKALDYPLLRLPSLFYTLDQNQIVDISHKYYSDGIDVPILYPYLPDH